MAVQRAGLSADLLATKCRPAQVAKVRTADLRIPTAGSTATRVMLRVREDEGILTADMQRVYLTRAELYCTISLLRWLVNVLSGGLCLLAAESATIAKLGLILEEVSCWYPRGALGVRYMCPRWGVALGPYEARVGFPWRWD